MKTIAIIAMLLQIGTTPTMPPLAPVGQWTINYEDVDCLLSHDFGAAPGTTTIAIKPSPFGDHVEVAALLPGAKGSYRKAKAKLVLQPSGLAVEKDAEVFALKDKNLTAVTVYTDADVATELPKSTGITIFIAGGPNVSVAVPGVKAAFRALKTCQTDLVKGWGLDPTEFDRVAKLPEGVSPADWITNDDYPADALATGKSGTTTMVWAVGLDGRVADCKIVQSAGMASLDHAACNAISRRGHYTPAVGTDGKPMVAHQTRKVRWQLP